MVIYLCPFAHCARLRFVSADISNKWTDNVLVNMHAQQISD